MRSALNNVPKYALKSLKHESTLSCGISIQRRVPDVFRCTWVCHGVKCHMPRTTNPKKILTSSHVNCVSGELFTIKLSQLHILLN